MLWSVKPTSRLHVMLLCHRLPGSLLSVHQIKCLGRYATLAKHFMQLFILKSELLLNTVLLIGKWLYQF
jgi:hypothetical protein